MYKTLKNTPGEEEDDDEAVRPAQFLVRISYGMDYFADESSVTNFHSSTAI